ncbi:2810_t:CDS:1, partial [Gigaspora rosea]
VTNVYQSNVDLPPLRFVEPSLIGNYSLIPPATSSNITFWETVAVDKFWVMVNLDEDEKDHFVEIRPTRYLTLHYEEPVIPPPNVFDWHRITIRTIIWFLKFVVFPAICIAFAISFL